jgi:dipeptidyl aminopeptidase/acylaminoacyl peptidase
MKPNRRTVGRAVSAIVVLILAQAAVAAAQQKFTLEQVMGAPFASELATSDHGARIAWEFEFKGVRNIFVADAPDFKPHQVTQYTADDGMMLASVRLTPDGKTVLYARGSETNQAGEVADPTSNVEQPHQQVFAVDANGGGQPKLLGTMECGQEGCEDVEISPDGQWAVWAARRQIWIVPVSGASPAKQISYLRGDNSQPKWSPDSKKVAFVSNRGDHSFVGIYEFGKPTILWMQPSVDRDSLPRWSRDGRQIAFVRLHGTMQKQPTLPLRPNPWAIYVGDPATGAAKAIWHSGTDLVSSFPQLTARQSFNFADGRIVFAYEKDGWNHLYSVPVAGGEETLLTPGDFEVEHVILGRDFASIIYSSNDPKNDPLDIDRRHIWRVAAAGGNPTALSSGAGSEYEPDETGDGKYVVSFGSSGTSPKMPYVLGQGGPKMIAAEMIPKDFPTAALVEPKQVIFKSEDGWTIHGQLFVPKGRTQQGPALVFMHGGSRRQMILGFHYMEYYNHSYAENQYLANQGYVVLSVNYRTGIMYGRAFREVVDGGPRGGSEYKDIVAAGKYLQGLPIVDPQKIGLWGGSYGGYLTAMGLARNSDIFKAGVDMHGVHDWSLRLGGRGGAEASPPPDQREATQLAFSSSPNSSIATWKSPVLLIQGDDDRNVAFTQTVDLAQRLRAQKVPFEQIVFPDEIHDFLLWRNWVRAYGAGADFFDRVLKRGEQIGMQ